MILFFIYTIFFGYLTSLLFYFLNFETQKKEALLVFGRQTLLAVFAGHFTLIVLIWSQKANFGSIQPWEDMVLIPFLILLFCYFMEWRYRAHFLMLFALPIVVLLCLLGALLFPRTRPLELSWNTPWLWIHMGLIFSGLAGLLTSVAAAVMYLMQSAQLKSRHPGSVFFKLPPLGTLEKVHFSSLSWGVVLFSLGILSGLFWATGLSELPQIAQDPKVVLSFITCFLYWVVLSFRLSSIGRGKKIAMGTVLIFALLFLTLMSSYYAPSGFHRGF